jgi:hypothetical protein
MALPSFIQIILIILLSSFWSILLVDNFDPYKQLLKVIGLYYHETENGLMKHLNSFNPFFDFLLYYLTKVFNCPFCFASYLCGIILLCLGSWYGFILMPITYFTTMFIKKYLDQI